MDDIINPILQYTTDYIEIQKIIVNFLKEKINKPILTMGISYLHEQLVNNNPYPYGYFSITEGNGDTKFNLTNEQIKEIIEAYINSMGYELKDIKYGDKVSINYRSNPKIKVTPVNLDIEYYGSMTYEGLKTIVENYYLETGKKVFSKNNNDLRNKIINPDANNGGPSWSMITDVGKSDFDLPKDKLERIIKEYLKDHYGCVISDIEFSGDIKYKYRINGRLIKNSKFKPQKQPNKDLNAKEEVNLENPVNNENQEFNLSERRYMI